MWAAQVGRYMIKPAIFWLNAELFMLALLPNQNDEFSAEKQKVKFHGGYGIFI